MEFFLLTALKHSYGLTQEDAAELATSIPIEHVYGSLGGSPLDACGRAYDSNLTLGDLTRSVASLNIVHEKDDDHAVFATVERMLETADRIAFIGFGFHPINLKRIRARPLLRMVKMAGTCYGMSRNECARMKHWGGDDLDLHDMTADQFIQSHPFFIPEYLNV